MVSIVQLHHILPISLWDRFGPDIQRWTDGQFDLNGFYNLAITATSGETSLPGEVPVHNGSHPWWNNAIIDFLDKLVENPYLSDEQKGRTFMGLQSYLRSALSGDRDYAPIPLFVNRTDPAERWCMNYNSTISAYPIAVETSLIDPACHINITPPAATTSAK